LPNKIKEYFTAGELASLYGIPKQTLLYYDKNKLLVPEFINDNGYRYYSVLQYLTLEIILNMRKLNISIPTIKEYLNNRSPEKFVEILRAKEKECQKIIEETTKMKTSLNLSLTSIQKLPTAHFEQIELRFHEKIPLLLSNPLNKKMTVREYVKILAHHNQTTFSKKHFKEFSTGWIIDHTEFKDKKFNNTIQYFSPVPPSFPSKDCCFRPEGLYLSVIFQGTYYENMPVIYDKIISFMQRNHLKFVSNIYVLPLKNHWLTQDIKAYINQVSVQVEYDE